MTTTLRPDADERTDMTLGVELFDYTGATRGFHVESAGSGRTALLAGLQAARDDGDPYHPDFDPYDLPLAYVSGSMWGNTDVYGVQVYRRSRFSKPRYAAFDYAREDRFVVGNKTIYTLYNEQFEVSTMPGYLFGDSYSTTSVEYTRNLITVETPLATHPRPAIEAATNRTIGQLKGTVNKYPMVINGVEREAGTIRFNDINIQPFDTPDARGFWVTYSFVEDEMSWYPEILFNVLARCDSITNNGSDTARYLSACVTDNSYMTLYTKQIADTYPVTYFANNHLWVTVPYEPIDYRRCFPTHDGGTDDGGSSNGGGNNVIPSPWGDLTP